MAISREKNVHLSAVINAKLMTDNGLGG